MAVRSSLNGSAVGGPGRKPGWLKKPVPDSVSLRKMEDLLRQMQVHTVCESALCPNRGECFAHGTATFLIMGDICTRNCAFCGIGTGEPAPPDPAEPQHIADAVVRLGLSHVVVTSVTRDDLSDGGAGHFVATIRAVRAQVAQVTVEVLVPDFLGRSKDIDLVLAEAPEVFNHNLETVPRLYERVRPRAKYGRSLRVLKQAADHAGSVVKTGLMVGLGEEPGEVGALLEEVARVGVSVVTIGQYLRPSECHLPVKEYVRPEIFWTYRKQGEALGLQVHAAPFVRSSFQARESFALAAGRSARGERSLSLRSGPGS